MITALKTATRCGLIANGALLMHFKIVWGWGQRFSRVLIMISCADVATKRMQFGNKTPVLRFFQECSVGAFSKKSGVFNYITYKSMKRTVNYNR